MTSSLFRHEALAARRQRLHGDVVTALPLPFGLITAFLFLILALGVAFLFAGSYARKETVSGYLRPDLGILKITAPRNGIIAEVHVEEGEHVAAGDPLLTIMTNSGTMAGRPVDEAVRA